VNSRTKRRLWICELANKAQDNTDAVLYRMCDKYDTLMERGRKTEEANELLTRVSNYRGQSASARRTAYLCGYSHRENAESAEGKKE